MAATEWACSCSRVTRCETAHPLCSSALSRLRAATRVAASRRVALQRNVRAHRQLVKHVRSALLDPARHHSVGLGLDMGRGEPRDVQHQAHNSAAGNLSVVISGPRRKIDTEIPQGDSIVKRFRLLLNRNQS